MHVFSCRYIAWTLLFILPLLIWKGRAEAVRSFVIEEGQTVYGSPQWIRLDGETTLLDIARNYDLGFNQITAANPGVDPWIPGKDTMVILPDIYILPQDRLASGIVVNLAEMRLYYFFSAGMNAYVLTAPIGVGREGFLTQLGIYMVKSKTDRPTWYVPESIRQEDPTLPAEVPPGPENPLGDFIFRLSRSAYGIHGTNKPWGVGRRVSHGCIRLYPEDIATLYPIVPVGTMVRITYEPVKIGWAHGQCWIQVFDDFEGKIGDLAREARIRLKACENMYGPLKVDEAVLEEAVVKKDGIARAVARPRAQQ
ncbi:MAG: L,D-transpeptidase family protein [Deltaproteobacteria bacterium]